MLQKGKTTNARNWDIREELLESTLHNIPRKMPTAIRKEPRKHKQSAAIRHPPYLGKFSC